VDEHELHSFLVIADLGSVTNAAARLGTAQPTLSQLLLRLEDELGVKLFQRVSRGVVPTDAGRVFQEHARAILKQMQRAREEVKQQDPVAHHIVPVGLPSSISMLLGARLMVAVRQKLSNVSVHLVETMSGFIRAWMEDRSLDIGVLHDVSALGHLLARPLVLEEIFLIGPGGRFGPLDQQTIARTPIPFAAAQANPLILPTRQHALRQLAERQFQGEGLPLQVEMEVDSLTHIKELVAAGHGYSLLSHAAVHKELAEGSLSAVRIAPPTLRRMVYLVRNPARFISRASVQIEDLMIGLMRDLISERTWLAEPASAQLESEQP
jgi:LysR family transcriptional regulator, nitrogen assimilation regulatory protein